MRVNYPSVVYWDCLKIKHMRSLVLLAVSLLFPFLSFGELYKVVRVIDGDTVVLHPQGNMFKFVEVRIWGIDTPEKYRTNKLFKQASKCNVAPEEIIRLGKEATRFAKLHLGPELIVELEDYGRDIYGRVLARVYAFKEDVGLKMVEAGYACVYRTNTNPIYIKAMEKAKKYRYGLWGMNFKLMECLCSP